MRASMEPMCIRVIVDHSDLHHMILKETWYADTLISKIKAIIHNTVANIYTQGKLIKVYSIMARMEARQ